MTKIVSNFIEMDNYIYFLVYVRMAASNSDLLKTIKSNQENNSKRTVNLLDLIYCKLVWIQTIKHSITSSGLYGGQKVESSEPSFFGTQYHL